MHHTAAVFHKLSLAAVDEDDSAAGAAHIMGLEALVENKHRSVYHSGALGLF